VLAAIHTQILDAAAPTPSAGECRLASCRTGTGRGCPGLTLWRSLL
jgi:hypothetical protein